MVLPRQRKRRFLAQGQLYTGWKGMTAVAASGDLSGDGETDLLARDTAGTLWLYRYPGISRIRIGGGWNAMKAIV
jgi:hypothetical protein